MSFFSNIACGETLPVQNVHAVSVSMPKLQDVIDYEENPQDTSVIKSGYPRFILHPYLRTMAKYIQEKYSVPSTYEVVMLSSKKAVEIVSDKYYIHNPFFIDEPFGVILVQKGTCQLQKVLTFIQHVGCNLSSRFAEDYLIEKGLINKEHQEERLECTKPQEKVLEALSCAYGQPKDNICLAPSGMNAIYSVIKGIRSIQERNGRNILVQFGWLYLDTMNIVEHHYSESKTFLDINNLDILEEYLKEDGLKVSAIITEVPTNPLLLCVDLKRLKALCLEYNIPLIIDSTLSTPFNIDLKPYADIIVESLTKYACGNADVLMGAVILNEKSRISRIPQEFFKHCDPIYKKDAARLAYEIQSYESRMEKINSNTKELISHLEKQPYIKKVYHTLQEENQGNYKELMSNENSVGGLISLEFNISFEKAYDRLNFAKGPSLGTEFTLLMPYVYLAHYDYITCEKGREFLKEHSLPIDLLRVSVGIEDITEIKKEFDRLKTITA